MVETDAGIEHLLQLGHKTIIACKLTNICKVTAEQLTSELTIQKCVQKIPAVLPETSAKDIHQLGRITESKEQFCGMTHVFEVAQFVATLDHGPLSRLLATCPGCAQLGIAEIRHRFQPDSAILERIN